MHKPTLFTGRDATSLVALFCLLSTGPGAFAESPAWQQAAGYRRAPLSHAVGGKPGFTLLANPAAGIHFTNTLSLDHAKANNNLMNGAGVAAGDFDRDGLCDLYFCNLDGPGRLYRNLGQWQFEDVTATAGVLTTNQASTGAVFADLDGDGFLDLLVTSCGGPNACFMNDGHGRFRNTTLEAGLVSTAGSTSMALADVDGDGDLDLYVANYASLSILRSGGAIPMRNVNGRPVVTGPFAKRLRFVDGELIELGEPDVLFLNDGRGRFTPVSWTGGAFLDEDGRPLSEPPQDLGLSVMFRDLNGDGAPDLYVCNDYEGPDRVWINDGKGRFRALPRLAMRSSSRFSMSVDFADINRDGWDDCFVADMLSRVHLLKVTQMGVVNPLPRRVGIYDDRPQIRRNTLFLNRGDGTFAEIANHAGLAASDWTWNVLFVDVDLDGYEDVLAVNGHAFDIQDHDATERIQQLGKPASLEEARSRLLLYPELKTPNYAFRNRGDLTFEETGRDWGFASTQVSHGVALADLDNDGDQDVVVNCLNAPPLIYRNEAAASRLAVRLKGRPGNTMGIGARIKVTGGPVAQSQEMIAGGRYVSGDEPLRVFAGGSPTNQMVIEVFWRSGARSVVRAAQPDWMYEIDEADAQPFTAPKPAELAPLFTDASALLNHRHEEEPFDDFARQPLLPHGLSQLGPGVAWFDLDRDGWDDLIIGCGRRGRMAVYRNDGQGHFQPWPGELFQKPEAADLTSVIGWTARPGTASVLAGRSSYESGATNLTAVLRYDLGSGTFSAGEALPGGWSSSGPVVAGDIDGDGDLDVFVGGRVIPGRYPEAASSRLFRNEQGKLVLDEANTRVLTQVGLVSGAVFGDLDGDGFPELILACEWGPLRIFQNSGGQLREKTTEWGLAGQTGWWNGVTTGDLDGDGRLDLIASNWGHNTVYHPSAADPARLRQADFDGDNALDLLEVETDPMTRELVPRRDLFVLGAVLPSLRTSFHTHREFGAASLGDVLKALPTPTAEVTATTFASTLFLNRGDHFESRSLPAEAQFAPALAVAVGDLDGDGLEDVFLSQNFFAVAPDMPRLDAGRGLWLKGDGHGGLRPMSGAASGIRVYGEQRGAALSDYDGDGRVDLVVTQNGAETRLYHNQQARPGLRVRVDAGPGNPTGVGAVLRLRERGKAGPAREIHAGSGYWSQDSAVQVMITAGTPDQLWVRWPGGKTMTFEIPANALEIQASLDGTLKPLKQR